MRIVLWSRVPEADAVRHRLSDDFDVVVVDQKADLPSALAGAEGFVLENSRYDAEVFGWIARSGVRWIQLLSAGYENLARHGVPAQVMVTNAGSARSAAVAEHGMALLLALLRAVPGQVDAMGSKAWRPELSHGIGTLEGKSALIVGYGDIGCAFTRRLVAFGANVSAVNRGPIADPLLGRSHPMSDMDAALAEADIVVVALAYVAATHHLITAPQFAVMKPGAMMVNVARGAIIDTQALVEALGSGRLAGAALDVTDPEPLPPDHPLWRAPNVLISPHIAGAATPATSARLSVLVHENASRFMRGEPLLAQIDL